MSYEVRRIIEQHNRAIQLVRLIMEKFCYG